MKWSQLASMLQLAVWGERPRPQGLAPRLDPRRVAAYVPAIHGHRPAPEPKERDEWWLPPLGSGCDPAPAGAAGLVGSPQFGQRSDQLGFPPRRNGFKGITANGIRRIRQGGQLLEEDPKLCGFWTITLPDEAIIHLHQVDGWHRFQSEVRRLLLRCLKRVGLDQLVVGVVELQPKRTAETHLPIPHLHILFQAKRHRKAPWPLGPGDMT